MEGRGIKSSSLNSFGSTDDVEHLTFSPIAKKFFSLAFFNLYGDHVTIRQFTDQKL